MMRKIFQEWIMNVGEIEEKLRENLSLADTNPSEEEEKTKSQTSDSQKENVPSPIKSEENGGASKVQTRIPRPSGIKAPSGIPRILSCSAQRPVSSTPQKILHKSEDVQSPDKISHITNRSISYNAPSTSSEGGAVTSPSTLSASANQQHQRRNIITSQSISRTDYSNLYSASSNNSQCPDTESQGSSGSRRSSSNYSYASLGEPRMINAKINSLANVDHVPGGGNVKIFNQKIDTSNVGSKCGSKANIHYRPGGGDIKIVNQKLEVKAESKTKSLKNVHHVPGGGEKKIYNETLPWLKYNAPKLSAEEKKRITKHQVKLQP